MPFRKWIVQPVFVSRNVKPPDKRIKDFEFENTTNGTLVKCLHQLGSVLEHADRIFDEIGSECRLVFERAERLTAKIQSCQEVVSNLNARAVKVPVSDLTAARTLVKRQAPYCTQYDQPTQLFLPSNRPQCIDKLYNECTATPVSVICTIDRYRTDGCTSSQLFMVTPVLGGTRRKKKKKMLDIETRKPASFSLAERGQEIRKLGCSLQKTVVSPSGDDESKLLDRLPLPEELSLAVSLEYPSSVVPVDVTGNSFLRMSKGRRSLIHADFEIKRKKSKHKSKRRHTVCEGGNKELEEVLQNITMVNNSCQTEELPESSSFFSFRRSFSRRKRTTDVGRRETIALDGLNLDLTKKDAEFTSSSQDRVNSLKKENQQSQTKKTGKGFLMSKAAKMNPISSLSAAISMAVKMRHPKSSRKQDDGRSSSGNWSASSSTRASIDSDQHHAVIVAVDRNSNISRSSAGKDSVLSDTTSATTTAQLESVRSQEHSAAIISEPSKFINNNTKSTRSNMLWDYDRGRESNTSTPERTSDCASTPLVMSPYTSRRNHHSNYYAPSAFDDGESSVYSVDTDGYYTSMHTDSGLWNGLNPVKENLTDSIRSRHRQESQSSVSTIGNGSINSFLSKVATENDTSSNCSSLRKQKTAPEPPPRVSSFNPSSQDEATEAEDREIQKDASECFEKESSPLKNGSASESDYESRDRIRVKTTINSSRYPSLCAVSPETSDDELTEMHPKPKLPTTNVVIAEVHREEIQDNDSNGRTLKKQVSKKNTNDLFARNLSKRPPVINMYGGHSPTESSFTSNLIRNNNVVSSTPKEKASVTSFTSDTIEDNKESPSDNQSLVQKLVSDLKHLPNPSKDLIVTNPPTSPKTVPHNLENTLIPLKYAQCITVTPIMRSESLESKKPVNSAVSTPPQRSRSFLKNPLSSLPFRHTENSSSKPKSPSYISFQSPDSPVSSSTSLSPDSATKGTCLTKKAVARVVLDPTGKVIYSSSSLDRNKREGNNSCSMFNRNEPKYATLPKYQGTVLSSSLPVQCTASLTATNINRNNEIQESHSQIHDNKPSNRSFPEFQYNSAVPQTAQSSKSQNLLFRPSRGGRFCRTYFPSHIISSAPQMHNTSPPPPSASVRSESSTSVSVNAKRTVASEQVSELNVNRCPQSLSTGSRKYFTSPTANHYNSLQRPYMSHSNNPPSGQKEDFDAKYQARNKSSSYSVPSSCFFRPVSTAQETKFNAPYTASSNVLHMSSNSVTLPSSNATSFADAKHFSEGKHCSTVSPLLSNYSYEQMESNGKISEFTPQNPPDVIPSSSTPPSTLDITARTVKSEGGLLYQEGNLSGDSSSLKSLSSSELFAIIHSSKKKHNIKTDSEKSLSPLSSRSSSPAVCMTPSPVKTPRIETGTLTRQNKDNSGTSSPKIGDSNSTTSDRLGRSKPTSMHDFKMLLLQTRVGGREPASRPSAAELLKVSPPRTSGQTSNTLPRTLSSSPVSKMQYAPVHPGSPVGHGTVPIKRMSRTRSPYLTRYDSTYPPIWEDCSEDLEAADENQNTVSSFTRSPSELLSNNDIYSTKMRYGKTVMDNEESRVQATSTWV